MFTRNSTLSERSYIQLEYLPNGEELGSKHQCDAPTAMPLAAAGAAETSIITNILNAAGASLLQRTTMIEDQKQFTGTARMQPQFEAPTSTDPNHREISVVGTGDDKPGHKHHQRRKTSEDDNILASLSSNFPIAKPRESEQIWPQAVSVTGVHRQVQGNPGHTGAENTALSEGQGHSPHQHRNSIQHRSTYQLKGGSMPDVS